MTRQNISTGSSANDGTGDTLRSAATKINSNFTEIYDFLGTPGDSSSLASSVRFEDSAVLFEGLTADANETRLYVENPSADRSVIIPNASGTIVLDTHTQTLTNKTLTSPTINTPKVGTSINDTNGNELIKFAVTTGAHNEITVTNGILNTSPKVSATGDSTNINILLEQKGTGSIEIKKGAYTTVEQTANGAAASTNSHVRLNKASALAVSMDSGTTAGEVKLFTNKGAGTASISDSKSPSIMAGAPTIVLTTDSAAMLMWDGAKWFRIT